MRHLLPATILLAAACQQAPSPTANQAQPSPAPSTAPQEPAAPAPAQAPAAPSAPAEVPRTTEADKSAAAAKHVLETYFAAVATKHYSRAYRLWSGNGAATGMSEAEFAASFAKYRIYDGNVGKPGETDGAAGSIYIEIPAKVTGVLARGGGFVLEGPMTLKRVNDVDGSTAEQRRWHIASSGLKPRP